MAINRCTFSNDLKAKDLCYSDEFFKLKSEKVIPSDSFTFDSYEAFKNINDFKTNNFSNLFLIDKLKNSDWLEPNIKEVDYLNGMATTISWFSDDSNGVIEKGSWLYFAKKYEMFDINVTKVDALLTYGKPDKDYSNYIFYLEFIDDNTCRISHTFGDLKFYLCVNEDKVVKFLKTPEDDSDKFIYCVDKNVIRFYKKVLHKKYNEVGDVVKTYHGFYTLGVDRSENTLAGELKMFDDVHDDTCVFAYIYNNSLDFNFYVDSSWISYDKKNNISSINRDRSAMNLATQSIIHHLYNKDNGFNFIPLKNNLSYRGNTIRGANLIMSDFDYPDVDFRTYNSLHTGFNLENGDDIITLSYVFNDLEYLVNDGDDLHFTIPEKSIEKTNGLEPLWPYKYININDTKFIKNGAFGSNTPFFADKIKKLQGSKSYVLDDGGKRSTPNNGVYLCSWLYKKNNESEPIWLDRYYYPDMIERSKALKGISQFETTFDNILDKNYTNNDYIRKEIYKNTYIDKVSDLIIEPSNSYIYQRLSSEMVNEVLTKMEPNLIDGVKSQLVKNQVNRPIDLWNEFIFDNENYRKINHKAWNNTNSINFNTDIYLNKNKKIGLLLFGSDYTSGFNILNRKDLAPYHYYATEGVVYLLNNKFLEVHKFNIKEKYGDTINKLILGDLFDDIIVITGIWIYILSYDLRLKSRIDLTANKDDKFAIKNLDLLSGIRAGEKIRLINYPYGDLKVSKPELNGKKYFAKITIDRPSVQNKKQIKRPFIITRRKSFYENNSGKKLYASNLSILLSNSNSILYKNNIYVPIDSKILKIIFCPENELDRLVFGENDRDEYPAGCRLLLSSEFNLNYLNNSLKGSNEENINLENGFIMVENKIKNLYIDEDGKIYGLNFDKYAVSPDGDTIYGLYGQDKYLATGQWFWLFNQSISKMQSDVSTSKYAEFASPNSIDAVKFNNLGEMCLIRNFHNLSDNENDDNNKRIDIYDKTKKRIYTFDLSGYEEIISLDSYNYISEAHEEITCFTALLKSYSGIYKVTYNSTRKRIETMSIDLDGLPAPCFYETINSNSIMRYKDNNSLYFNLHVPSGYVYDYIATIKWDLKDIQEGWYNLNVFIDLDEAIFEVRVNDIILDTINEKTHNWFVPHVSSNGTVFNGTYYIGCLGKKYGTTLNDILKNAPYDPYICKNSKLSRMTIYNRKLEYYEFLAMRLRKRDINPIILTLPCGNRNNIDEIIRYFKYNSAGAISNKVKINVSGTGLQTEGEFELVRNEIMLVLSNNKDCLVDVKEIEFI